MGIRFDLRAFLADEAGVVAPDFVVLTGAIVGLGLVMMAAVGQGVDDISESAKTAYGTPRVSLEQGGDDGGGMTDPDITVVVTY